MFVARSPGVEKKWGELVEVREYRRAGVLILQPRAELTADTEPELQAAFRRHLNDGHVHLVLDLAHVPHVDSTGLGRIVQAYVSAQRLGGEVQLMNVGSRTLQLLTVTRLLSILKVYEPTEQAVRV